MAKIYVIGIGYKPLDKRERKIIYNSEIILSSSRLFEVFRRYREFGKVKEKVLVIDTVDETIEFIKSKISEHGEEDIITVLASGDPLFFGIGRRIINEFGKDKVDIMPDLSSIQIAFSRIKEPWDNAFLMSLHRGPDPQKRRSPKYEIKDIPALLERHKKIAILTDMENNPAEISKVLISSTNARDLSPLIFVCEKLGYPDEKITKGTPEEISAMSFSTPNVTVILVGD